MMRKVLTVLVVLTVTLVSAAGRSKGATGMPNDRLAVTASVLVKSLTLPSRTYDSPSYQGLNLSSAYALDLQWKLDRSAGFLGSRHAFAVLCVFDPGSDSLLARPCLVPENQSSSILSSIPPEARVFNRSHFLLSPLRGTGRFLRIYSSALVVPSSLRTRGVEGVVIVLEVVSFPDNLSAWSA